MFCTIDRSQGSSCLQVFTGEIWPKPTSPDIFGIYQNTYINVLKINNNIVPLVKLRFLSINHAFEKALEKGLPPCKNL